MFINVSFRREEFPVLTMKRCSFLPKTSCFPRTAGKEKRSAEGTADFLIVGLNLLEKKKDGVGG